MRHVTIVSRCLCGGYEFQKQFLSWNFLVPREELFSSKGGTFQFQGRNSAIPTWGFFFSNGGKENFQGWKRKFPTEENKISSVGNLFFQGWKVFGKLRERLDGCRSLKMVDFFFVKTDVG